MPIHKVQNRIIVFFLSLIAVILLLSFFVVSATFQLFIERQSERQILTGRAFFEQILEIRGNDLISATKILAEDRGFKQTIGQADRTDVHTELKAYAAKANADIAMLLNLDGKIEGCTLPLEALPSQYPFPKIIENARLKRKDVSILPINGTAYHLALVPLLTPLPSGWLAMGYALNSQFLKRISQLNDMDISLYTQENSLGAIASTFPSTQLKNLTPLLSSTGLNSIDIIRMEDTSYFGTRFALPHATDTPIFALLQKSLQKRVEITQALHKQLGLIFLFSILLGILGTYFLAKGITQPIQSLIQAIKTMAKGGHAEPIIIRDGDELSDLATEFNSMQAAIEQREKKIRHQAYYDQLTELPNRTYFLDKLTEAITSAKKNHEKVFVVAMDLNRFKDINDTLGHKSGDTLLQLISDRLNALFKGQAFVARLGGDEFALLLNANQPDDLIKIAKSAHKAINQPINMQNMNLDISASMGIAYFPEHGKEPVNILQRADIAMTAAKEEKTLYKFYDPTFDKHSVFRLSLMNELKAAVRNDDLVLYYQPKVDLKTQKVVSVESLVRWIHPKHGIVSPTKFIPLAEQTGHIRYLTRWALHTAVKQAFEWQEANLAIRVAINISAVDLLDTKLVDEVREMLKKFPVRPDAIVLEVTESAILGDLESALDILHELRALGISLSIDDFGTGYSSMAQLKTLPVQELKIDQSFIRNLLSDSNDQIIVRSTIELAHNMSLNVVGEGIDDENTLAMLVKLDCDIAQGHYFSPPLSITDFSQWLIQSPYGIQSS